MLRGVSPLEALIGFAWKTLLELRVFACLLRQLGLSHVWLTSMKGL